MASTSRSPDADVEPAPYANSYHAFFGVTDNGHLQSPPTSNSTSSTPPGDETKSSPEGSHTQTHYYPHCHSRPRRLHEPHGPIYVPAALRPTEQPVKYSPPKHGIKAVGRVYSNPPTPPGSSGTESERERDRERFDKVWLDEDAAKKTMTRMVPDEWRELEDVTGLPTKSHWKPDSAAEICDFGCCPATFTLFNRRHHCRRCGMIFCAEHSAYLVPLDQHARFHDYGEKLRACECCWHDYKVWEMYRKNQKPYRPTNAAGNPLKPGKNVPKIQVQPATDADKATPEKFGSQSGDQLEESSEAKPIKPKNSPVRLDPTDNEDGNWWNGSYKAVQWSNF